MMERYFEVSAAWMQACGMGTESRIYPVLRVETNLQGAKGFDSFIVLDTGSSEWTVAARRGSLIYSTTEE